jgi:integrase/recombinase XerD
MARGGLKMVVFESFLGPYLNQFVNFKRLQGFDYTDQEARLGRFDQFLQKQGYNLTILSSDIIDAYIDELSELKLKSRATRLSSVRTFSKYLNARFSQSSIIPDSTFKLDQTLRFYLYSKEDVSKLMKSTHKLRSKDKLRASCMRYLIALLYCTGLRIGEALSLTRADVDLINCRLFVKEGKFGKQRYVPLDESVVTNIQQWCELCKQQCSSLYDNSPLFIDQDGKKLMYYQVNDAFTSCRKHCALMHGVDSPRLHDFRHTYACNCILKWQATGEVNTKLPILATVLGHVNIESSQVYLHISSKQLQQAATQFYEFYTSNKVDLS